ncbi:putative cinnamyl alcohol dehydrogenase [Arachis hypogaea]|nr:putative cinnamyl alcohol dehydrogenase [Arachis hypogaea]
MLTAGSTTPSSSSQRRLRRLLITVPSPEVLLPSSSEISASSPSSLRSRRRWPHLSLQIVSSPSRSDFLIVMPFFSHRRLLWSCRLHCLLFCCRLSPCYLDSDFRGNHHHHESPKASTLRPLTCIRNTLDAAMCLQFLVGYKTSLVKKLKGITSLRLSLRMRSIFGSATGGMKDTQEMIDLCAEKEIYPNIEVIPIEYANEAFERIINKDVKYRRGRSLREKRGDGWSLFTPLSGDHNLSYGAPIDERFVTTRCSCRALGLRLWIELGGFVFVFGAFWESAKCVVVVLLNDEKYEVWYHIEEFSDRE